MPLQLWCTLANKGGKRYCEVGIEGLPPANAQKHETYVVATYDLGDGMTNMAKNNLWSILKEAIGPTVNLLADIQKANDNIMLLLLW